jgi:hypothetical protein
MSDMKMAYKLAALAVRQRLAEQHPEDLDVLRSLRRGDVAAYTGNYDQAEKVLECLGVPAAVDPDPVDLQAKVLFSNCSGSYNPKLLERIRGYVEDGRWLVSSDWSLHYVVERHFPDTVRWTHRTTGTEVVSVEPNLESLWSEVVVLGADPQWWLWGSYPIEVVDPERVRVEARSHDLLTRYNAPVVAVRFDWGRGHVFHVISHFWAKTSATPTLRHQGPGVDFLRAGMRLSDEGIEKVLRQAKAAPDAVNFATLQSAVTATELVAQLCVRGVQATA